MIPAASGVEARLAAALADTPPRIPVLLGPCGCGRTRALQRLRDGLPPGACQYIDLERVMSSPEQFLRRITAGTPFAWPDAAAAPAGPREAYDRILAYFAEATAPGGGPATFAVDEALELRGLENFPGLSNVMTETLAAMAASRNHFVLASKYETRALAELRKAPDRFLVVHAEPVTAAAIAADLLQRPGMRSDRAEDAARLILALTEGRAAYVTAIVTALLAGPSSDLDPVGVLAALLESGRELDWRCRFSYEMRLHRARGYGALKAVLGILAEDEPLTLTEVAQRVLRTPGSTRDYLGWLEDVDLVCARRKRYAFADPVLRLWVRLATRCSAPGPDDLAEEVRRYAVSRLAAGPLTPR